MIDSQKSALRIKKTGQQYSLALIFALVFSVADTPISFAATTTPIQEPASKVEVEDPVPILATIEEDMFPKRWLKPDLNTSAELVPDKEKDRAIGCIRRAFAKYPENVLKKNLDKVYVVGVLKFSGITAGGTNSSKKVYLAVQSASRGYTDKYVEGAFHHEFSSILLRKHAYRKLRSDWRGANPKEFEYSGTGTEAVRNGKASERYNPTLAKKGFFSQYAQASFEEDFNTIATVLLMGDERIWEAADKFPAIMKKVKLTIALYQGLDNTLNEEFFHDLRPEAVKTSE